jgi:hypothetical protein
MSLRSRPMLPKDTRECAEIIARHPVVGPRYGRAIQHLQPAWLRLLGSEAIKAAMFEEVNGMKVTTCGFGAGVFVRDDFVREVKTHPLFWLGPELVKRITRGPSPVLSDREVRELNSGAGLNLVVWEAVSYSEFGKRTDVFHFMTQSFLQEYRGFLLKEIISPQLESAARLQSLVDAGGLYWDPKTQSYTKSLSVSPEKFLSQPHIVGMTRELEFARLGSWVGTLFDYHRPQFFFAPAEQRLLLAALAAEGGTDRELCDALNLSLATVKKQWLSIYQRVADRCPEILRLGAPPGTNERGKEKKRRLLAYIREHPEELRPFSRKRTPRVRSALTEVRRVRPGSAR